MKQITATVTHTVTSTITFEVEDNELPIIGDDIKEIIAEWPLMFTVDEGGGDIEGWSLAGINVLSAEAPMYVDVDFTITELEAHK